MPKDDHGTPEQSTPCPELRRLRREVEELRRYARTLEKAIEGAMRDGGDLEPASDNPRYVKERERAPSPTAEPSATIDGETYPAVQLADPSKDSTWWAELAAAVELSAAAEGVVVLHQGTARALLKWMRPLHDWSGLLDVWQDTLRAAARQDRSHFQGPWAPPLLELFPERPSPPHTTPPSRHRIDSLEGLTPPHNKSDRCPHCNETRGGIDQEGHAEVDGEPCPEACTCIPECFSMAEHRELYPDALQEDT